MKISRFKSKHDIEHRYRELLLANQKGEFALANELHSSDWLTIHYMLEVMRNHSMGMVDCALNKNEVDLNHICKDFKRVVTDYIELCEEVLSESDESDD